MNMSSRDRLIVALDATSLSKALSIARRLKGLVRTVKVGSALFTTSGPEALRAMRLLGFDVMLDLKFFDIPSTVGLSCRVAAKHRAKMVTVHASGSPAMLEAAVSGARLGAGARAKRPLVMGVTVLTSVGVSRRGTTARSVLNLARRAMEAGCDGVVASAHEAVSLRRRFGNRIRIVCPGIRLSRAGRLSHDQRRVATPAQAIAAGADWIVVGRPITSARDKRKAAEHMLSNMETLPI